MRFEELDERLRVYEEANDRWIPPGFQVVARLDGRGFTRLTKELMEFEAPYDSRFRDAMTDAMRGLMDCGFRVLLAYAQSDEISLLFHQDCAAFSRKHRKWLSVLAGEASARLSLALGQPAVLDCRLSELPDAKSVTDYFRWRMEDASRNCLNSHCYWLLRRTGEGRDTATEHLRGMTTSAKHDLLFANGINFDKLPVWQKRGYCVIWESYRKEGRNPITGESTVTSRRRLAQMLELPHGDELSSWLRELMTTAPDL